MLNKILSFRSSLLIGHALLLLLFVFFRLVDGDEGFYLEAARAVGSGKTPYIDFFYPQMPYLPYILSPFANDGFNSLYESRIVSVLVSLITALLFFRLASRFHNGSKLISVLLVLYLLSGLNISWHSVAKTYAWTDLFLLSGFLASLKYADKNNIKYAMFSGAAVALAVNFRLVLLPLFIVFLLYLILNSTRYYYRGAVAFLVSALAISIPSLVLFLADPQRFYFNNLGFHLMRNPDSGFLISIVQKIVELLKIASNPQTLILAVFFFISLFAWWRTKKNLPILRVFATPVGYTAVIALTLIVVYILPNPVHQQYFVQAVPFVILLLPYGIEKIKEQNIRFPFKLTSGHALKFIFVIYCLGIIPYMVVFFSGRKAHDGSYHINNVRAICDLISQKTTTQKIYSEWAGFAVLSQRQNLDGLEFIGFDYPLPISDSLKRFYHFPVALELAKQIEEKKPAFCIVYDKPQEELRMIISESYQLLKSFKRYHVYELKP